MKKFLLWALALIGLAVVGGAIGIKIYSHNQGYDNLIEWVKDTKLFNDNDTDNAIIIEETIESETENTDEVVETSIN